MNLRSQPISAAEHAALRSYLARLGWQPNQVNAGVGTQPNNRSRAQVAADLANFLRQAPKA